MREIKFRAWNGEMMIYPLDRKMLTVGEIITRYENIMQFTGLLDKNGKEIYEGDVIESDNPNYGYGDPNEPDCLYTKIKSITDFYEDEYLKYKCKSSNVIGNIYENPELL